MPLTDFNAQNADLSNINFFRIFFFASNANNAMALNDMYFGIIAEAETTLEETTGEETTADETTADETTPEETTAEETADEETKTPSIMEIQRDLTLQSINSEYIEVTEASSDYCSSLLNRLTTENGLFCSGNSFISSLRARLLR